MYVCMYLCISIRSNIISIHVKGIKLLINVQNKKSEGSAVPNVWAAVAAAVSVELHGFLQAFLQAMSVDVLVEGNLTREIASTFATSIVSALSTLPHTTSSQKGSR